MPRRRDSVTRGRSQLDLFTDRHRQVLAFTKALSQDPPLEEIFFFGGGGGNGKSLLLWFLEEHSCKRFPDWETQIGDLGPEERMSRLVESTEAETPEVEFEPVPVVSHDFAAQPREFEQPKVAYDALAMLRRALSAEGFQFPIYTFASIWSLKQRNQLDDRRLKTLIPDEETGIISTIVDAITDTSWGSIASGVLNVLGDQLQEKWTLWQAQWGVDESLVTEIMEMDTKRELPLELPYYFAQDLNTEMEASDAPERVALLFDHYEAFSHQDSSESGPPGSGSADRWVADLLSALDQSKGILPVLAGRDQPQWDGGMGGEQVSLRPIPVTHFTDTDAEDFLQKAKVEPQRLRDKLKEFARVEAGQVHPLFAGLGVDIVRAAADRGHTLTADDLPAQDAVSNKREALLDRFFYWADERIEDATRVLSAARTFDRDLYFEVADRLRLDATNAAFTALCDFSFVWQTEGDGDQYRIHALLRRILHQQEESRTLEAHEALEEIYREQAEQGSSIATAEAIYHRAMQDGEAGLSEWHEGFEDALNHTRFGLCEAFLDVRTEFAPLYPGDRGILAYYEAEYYRRLARHSEALEAYQEAIEAFKKVLRVTPNNAKSHNNKGNALSSRADLLVRRSDYGKALEAYQEAVEAFEEALDLAPDYMEAHSNKGNALQGWANLLARLTKHDRALEAYREAVEAYEKALGFAPDYADARNNKGAALQSRADLLVRRSDYGKALEAYQKAVEAFEEALDLAPDYTEAHNNKGIALLRRADLLARLTKHDRALEAYREAVEAFEEALDLAPDYMEAHSNKGAALRGRADLLAQLSKHDRALEAYQEAIGSHDYALDLSPDYVSAHNNKGAALQGKADLLAQRSDYGKALEAYQKAVEAFEEALDLAPDYMEAHNNKGIALRGRADLLAQLSKHDRALEAYQEAIKTYNQALGLIPDHPHVLCGKANTLLNRGKLLLRGLRMGDTFGKRPLMEAQNLYNRALQIAPYLHSRSEGTEGSLEFDRKD